MSSEANREQAERAAELAIRHAAAGNHADALRLFDKSLRLYELPVVRVHRDRLIVTMSSASAEEDEAAGTPASSFEEPAPPKQSAQRPAQHSSAPPQPRSSQAGAAPRAEPPRQRPARQAAATSARSSTGQAHQRPYTPEHAALVEQVRVARDYYVVLGVEKDADAESLKRAYRKLAVKMHPDKNPAPGAEDAFKRVGAAFAILSDAEKRAHYDRYGEEEGSGGGGAASSGTRADARARHYARYEEEISPEDIFNMFFGGAFPGMAPTGRGGAVYTDGRNTFRVNRGGGGAGGGRQHHQQQREEEAGGNRAMHLMQLLPILILVLFTLASFATSNTHDERVFSLQPDAVFRVDRKTSSFSVVRDLPYFVKDDFVKRWSGDRSFLMRVEKGVESELFSSLNRKCTEEKQQRRSLENRLYSAKGTQRDEIAAAMDKIDSTGSNCALKTKYFKGMAP